MRACACIAGVQKRQAALARQTPPDLSSREPTPQTGVVSFAEWCLVHVAAHHCEQILHQARLRATAPETVVHPPAVPPRLDEADGAETAQVPGDLVLRHAERIHKLADAQFLLTQQPQQSEPCRVRHRLQKLVTAFIVIAPPSYATDAHIYPAPHEVSIAPRAEGTALQCHHSETTRFPVNAFPLAQPARHSRLRPSNVSSARYARDNHATPFRHHPTLPRGGCHSRPPRPCTARTRRLCAPVRETVAPHRRGRHVLPGRDPQRVSGTDGLYCRQARTARSS